MKNLHTMSRTSNPTRWVAKSIQEPNWKEDTTETKICRTCGVEKNVQEYYVGKTGKNGQKWRKPTCKECELKAARKKYHEVPVEKRRHNNENNPCNSIEYRRKIKLWNKYGLTTEQFDSMLKEQDSKCKICKRKLHHEGSFKEKPHVDHCHSTGKVRGLLCGWCNQGIGSAFEDVSVLSEMINYLNDSV